MSKSWVCEVEQAPDGEYFIQMTDEMLEGSGFAIGDELDWIDNKDGSFTLTKKKDTVWVLVECVAQYRMRYMVEAPREHPEYAMDTVTMDEAKEFSQQYLGEVITSHRVVSQEEALEMSDVDNDYTVGWDTANKMRCFFTKEGETRDY